MKQQVTEFSINSLSKYVVQWRGESSLACTKPVFRNFDFNFWLSLSILKSLSWGISVNSFLWSQILGACDCKVINYYSFSLTLSLSLRFAFLQIFPPWSTSDGFTYAYVQSKQHKFQYVDILADVNRLWTATFTHKRPSSTELLLIHRNIQITSCSFKHHSQFVQLSIE